MRSLVIRHWTGALGTWWSLLATFAIYVVATAAVVGAGSVLGGRLSTVPGVILFGLWSAIIVAAAIGTLRSALRALRTWRSRRVNALGGIVAVVVLGVAAFGVALDLKVLLLEP